MSNQEEGYIKTIKELREENKNLKLLVDKYKKIIDEQGWVVDDNPNQIINRPNHIKLNIFLDYFKGREDCYAIRFEGKESSGYAPKYKSEFRYSSNENRLGVSKKDLYEPFTKEVVELHLKGNQTVGLYPMLDDQKTYFLAIDFDKQSFKDDVKAFTQVAKSEGFSPLIEISRSGKGAHIWFFFQNKVLAKEARTLGKILLSKTMLEQRSLSLDSYDRMFPAQDFIDDNQIGNLIALPLNGKSGQKGTTLFVDDNFKLFEDQYGQLAHTKKITEEELRYFLEQAKHFESSEVVSNKMKSLDIRPLDFLNKLTLKVSNEIRISKSALTPRSEQFFMRYSSLLNPEYYKKKAMRYSTYQTPRIIELFKEDNESLYLPRGLLDKIINELKTANVDYDLIDDRQSKIIPRQIKMHVDLYNHQKVLFKEVIKSNQGIIVAPTGYGKTVLGIALTAHLQMNTLVLTNRVSICKQWKTQISDFSNTQDIGICYGGKCNLGNKIDVATFQSLNSYESIEKLKDHYGLILIDEVHHLAAYTFEQVIRTFSAKHIYGLTATPKRSDGLETITEMLIGGIIAEGMAIKNNVQKDLYIRFMDTQFTFEDDIHDMTNTIMYDKGRNRIIVDDILYNIHNNKTVLVLSERVEHLNILKEHLRSKVKNLFVLHGKLSQKEKNIMFETIKNVDDSFVILATGKYIGEGFDDDRLDTLLITMPFKWKGTLAQYVGRLNRQRQGKKEVSVYDYVDIQSRIYSNMFLKRQRGYNSLGFNLVSELETKQYLYNIDNYDEKLIDDIKSATDSITFMIKNSHTGKLNKLVAKTKLETKEIKHSVNLIIVDEYIVWYGSINPFTYSSIQEDSIMRIENKALAKKLIQSE
ncbi:TOTE conflict system archaeo-eukaryotic primase domain-containing protein [Liberiplasma polymorphum]|uniref:TOTE conflict system archaeo-eukaryotic primase domain-containing protein n=1 Tax=Liberiplasma polymorphum TaxID=3374570 RepID=UPI00377693A2